MRVYPRRYRSACVALAAFAAALAWSAHATRGADEPNLSGNWKLIRLQLVDAELLTFDIKQTDGKLSGSIAEPANLRDNEVKSVERKGEQLILRFSVQGSEFAFRGKAGKGDVFLGTFHTSDAVMPARLKKTDDAILAQPRPPQDLFVALQGVDQTKEPKAKADKLAAIVADHAGEVKYSLIYADLVRYASLADEPVDKVRKYVDEWVKSAEPYGTDWSVAVRAQAIGALDGKKPYAELALGLAQDAEKQFNDETPLDRRAEIMKGLATAAKLAGKAEIAANAAARAQKLEAEIDADYHKKVPPFEPEKFAGRKDKAGDRVVLLELFTGAQCPPCVAADVAFDALNETYKPSELVTLQYHLHIPGPDPLTNPATVGRQEYYTDLRGTPGAYFNGQLKQGGGGMAQAEGIYGQYRELIQSFLEQPKRATIDLSAERSGDELKIKAAAKMDNREGDGKKDDSGAAKSSDSVKLRLVLAEEQVKYVGGNRLRFHHHVVRAMPGGPQGKALSEGAGTLEVSVNLPELRQELDAYLDKFAKEKRPFPHSRPPIALKDLMVVAFVQDDSSKAVLHAVSVRVGDSKAETKSE